MLKLKKSKDKQVVVGLVLVLMLIIVFKPTLLSFVPGGGTATLSVNKIVLNDNTNSWVINAVHSGMGDSYNITNPTTFKEKSGYATEKSVTLRESNYETWCKYPQGSYVGADYVIKGPVEVGKWNDAEALKSIKKDHPNAVKVWCSLPHGWFMRKTCYYKEMSGKYYNLENKGPQFKSTFSLGYNGKTASVNLSNDNLNGNLEVDGKQVGYINVVGGLNSLKDICGQKQYYWKEENNGVKEFVPVGFVKDNYAIQEFEDCIGRQWLGTMRSADLNKCFDSYKNLPKDKVVTESGTFLKDTGGKNYFKIIPDNNVVNVEYAITVSADFVKVNRPVGVPKIISAGFMKDSYSSGDKAVVKYVIKNDKPDSNAVSFDMVLTCDGGFTQSFGSSPYVKGGEETTGYLAGRASCISQEFKNSNCVLKAQGYVPVNGKIPESKYNLKGSCEPSVGKCEPLSLTCSEDMKSVVQCDADGYGSNVIKNCDDQCVIKDGKAVCKGGKGTIINEEKQKGGIKVIYLVIAGFVAISLTILFSGVKRKKK